MAVSNNSISGKVGDTVNYEVNINLEPGHSYGAGSKIVYDLPQQFSNLIANSSIMYNGKVIANVTISGQKVTITFTNEIRDGFQGTIANANFNISGKLKSISNNWSETIYVPGYDTITLNFTPKANTGSKITKDGKADNGAKNSQYITWTVEVNTNLGVNSNSGTTTFKDVLTGEHTFEAGAIQSIHELNIDPNGNAIEGDQVPLGDLDITISSDKQQLEIDSEHVLIAGEYEVYFNNEKIDDITVKYAGDCGTTAQPKPSCQQFTIQLKDEDDNVRPNVEVTLKTKDGTVITTVSTDGDGKFIIPSTTKAGKYDLYEDKLYLQEVTVTYKGDCKIEIIQVPKCPSFTMTSIYDVDGNKLGEGEQITLKNKATANEVTRTINGDGKVTIENLESGTYEVFNGEGKLGEFTTNTTCELDFEPKPSCSQFSILLKDENGQARPNVDVTVKAKDGTEITTVKTNEDGKIIIPSTIPSGKYDFYENKVYLGEVTVTYKGDCKTEIIQAPIFPIFIMTSVYDVNGNKLGKGKEITLKNKATANAVTGTIDEEGKVKFSNLATGTYEVFNGEEKLGEFTTTTNAELNFEPKPSCPLFKITVKNENGEALSNIKVTVKDTNKNIVAKGLTTNKNGEISLATSTLPAGQYKLYENQLYLGTMTVDYKNT